MEGGGVKEVKKNLGCVILRALSMRGGKLWGKNG